MKTLKQMRPHQVRSYRRMRDYGFSIKEARRIAVMTASQLADEIRRCLQRQAAAKLLAHGAKHKD